MTEKNNAITDGVERIRVYIANAGSFEVPPGISLQELLKYDTVQRRSPVVAAMVNNVLVGLRWNVHQNSTIEFVDLESDDGMRVYTRSLVMLLVRAASEILPGCRVRMEHTLGNGVYGEVDYSRPLRKADVEQIEARMFEIVRANEPVVIDPVPKEEMKKLLLSTNQAEKLDLLRYRRSSTIWVHTCGWFKDFTYGNMVPDTGCLGVFRLRYYMPGFILELPRKENPTVIPEYVEQGKLANIYYESEKWSRILQAHNLVELNELILQGKGGDLIRVAEAFHEKKIGQIADQIADNLDLIRIVLIAGPSSSGKTTFAQRLGVQLRIHGIRPVPISLDDYFVDRELTPRDEHGEYDFECIDAIDRELFNEHLISLIQGEEVQMPTYDFLSGKRSDTYKTLKLGPRDLLIVEGIHGLNDLLTASIPKGRKFKIYVSALTQINLDNHNWIPTTYLRILRRTVRDYHHRGYSAVETIRRWPSVRRGEERHIFPFQESADVMFNSALIYELAVLKGYVEPVLNMVGRENREYAMVRRLKRFLGYFEPLAADEVPSNSIIREFIGGSCFLGH
ncbi:nucleoside kinase [Desulfallas thermosapovorans]|uniref:Uridine kinase n=1 Tax=Desulfallas thermosapovorans DSM 6562 TaxID=1121431 RepID=A0A5S4ZNP6_9FIRM|nr:nucleoside kinase [Desulfallas thermosapovorans]TYO93357.1 uridine kinase [Desulfallas thermosapovorans DSM 6562]